MLVLPIGLAILLSLHGLLIRPEPDLPAYVIPLGVLLPKLLLLALLLGLRRLATARIARQRGRGLLIQTQRLFGFAPWLLMLGFAGDLTLGALEAVRQTIGDLILIDELVVMLPTLLAAPAVWWVHYPMERRLREARLMHLLDRGLPMPSLPTRREYVTQSARHQLGLLLPPILLIMAWGEAVLHAQSQWDWPEATAVAVSLAGSLLIFVASPLIVRRVWDTVPLPEGELRNAMTGIAKAHGVRVRNVLLWRTHTGLANAAVLGMVPGLRYILISDGLLDALTRPQVRAVMAHEVAHARLKHIPWMLGGAIAGLLTLDRGALLLQGALLSADTNDGLTGLGRFWLTLGFWSTPQQGLDLTLAGAMVIGMVLWLLGFGYLSRRMEWQADTFAARHLTQHPGEPTPPTETSTIANDVAESERDGPPPRPPSADQALPPAPPNPVATEGFAPEAIDAMAGALLRVAEIAGMPLERFNWRHGSIARRLHQLDRLRGAPLARPAIDRVNARLRWAILGIGVTALLSFALA